MKKTLLIGSLILSSSLMADYELFTSYTKPKNFSVSKQTLLFSGTFSDYQKSLKKPNVDTKLYYGLLTPVIMSFQSDELFIRVEKLESSSGKFTLKKTFMVGDKHPSYSLAQANDIMKRGN